MKRIATSLALIAATAIAAPASSAVYNITSIEDGSLSGFGFSLFHSQKKADGSYSRMGGSMIEDPDPATLGVSGTWNSNTGAISFEFDFVGAGSVSANGALGFGGTDFSKGSVDYKSIGGDIVMDITGATNIADNLYTMNFGFGQQGGSIANAVDSDFGFINLWGDHGWDSGACKAAGNCFGVDLRLGIELATMPLPASSLLLIGGLAGLGGMRKLRKKS